MKRIELHKMEIFLPHYYKTNDATASSLYTINFFKNITRKKLLTFSDHYNFTNTFICYYENCVKQQHLNANRLYDIFDFLLDDVVIKTNKDFYLKSLFYEIFYFIGYHSAFTKIYITDFIAKVNSNLMAVQGPEDFFSFIDNNIDNDFIYKQLIILYHDLIKNCDNLYKMFTPPSFCSVHSVIDIIQPSNEEDHIKELLEFFNQPYTYSKDDMYRILNQNYSNISVIKGNFFL